VSNQLCPEPLVWTCKICGHSFHEKEWQAASRCCPACNSGSGSWKCTLCNNILAQPALGALHPCLNKASAFKNRLPSKNVFQSFKIFPVLVLIFISAIAGVVVFLNSKDHFLIMPTEKGSEAIITSDQNKVTPQSEEHACSEGWVAGIVYDSEGGSVNLRAEPGETSKIISKVESGTPAHFQNIEGEWKLAVVFPKGFENQTDHEDTCYVHENRLFMAMQNIDPDPPTWIFAGPAYDTAVIGKVGKDVPIYAQTYQDHWLAVVAGSKETGFVQGFVPQALLKDPGE